MGASLTLCIPCYARALTCAAVAESVPKVLRMVPARDLAGMLQAPMKPSASGR